MKKLILSTFLLLAPNAFADTPVTPELNHTRVAQIQAIFTAPPVVSLFDSYGAKQFAFVGVGYTGNAGQASEFGLTFKKFELQVGGDEGSNTFTTVVTTCVEKASLDGTDVKSVEKVSCNVVKTPYLR